MLLKNATFLFYPHTLCSMTNETCTHQELDASDLAHLCTGAVLWSSTVLCTSTPVTFCFD